MDILALTQLFSSLLDLNIYALHFPEYVEGSSVKMEFSSGVAGSGGVMDSNVQFMVKAGHPAEAETICLNILTGLDGVTNKEFKNGTYQLILCKATAPQPFYEGQLVDGAFLYSVDFRILATKI